MDLMLAGTLVLLSFCNLLGCVNTHLLRRRVDRLEERERERERACAIRWNGR